MNMAVQVQPFFKGCLLEHIKDMVCCFAKYLSIFAIESYKKLQKVESYKK